MPEKGLALVLLALGIASAPAPALADDDLLRPFQKCREIQDSARRLECYDAAVATSEALAKQLGERQKARRAEDFGLRSDQIIARDAVTNEVSESTEVSSVSSEIMEIWTDSSRRRVFMLANGQVWRETSNSTVRGVLRPDAAVEIKRGGIGGYRMTIKDRYGFIGVSRVK